MPYLVPSSEPSALVQTVLPEDATHSIIPGAIAAPQVSSKPLSFIPGSVTKTTGKKSAAILGSPIELQYSTSPPEDSALGKSEVNSTAPLPPLPIFKNSESTPSLEEKVPDPVFKPANNWKLAPIWSEKTPEVDNKTEPLLVTGSERVVYQIKFPNLPPAPSQLSENITPSATTNKVTQPTNTQIPVPVLVSPEGTIEITADHQTFDSFHQVVTAEGKVLMRFQGGVIDADRLQINLVSRQAIAEGNVSLARGDQLLQGERVEFNFVQGGGVVEKARGELFIPSSGGDFSPYILPTDVNANVFSSRPLSDRIRENEPLQGVNSPGGIQIGGGSEARPMRLPGQVTEVRRLRYEAEKVEFTPRFSIGRNVRITNDPFSPPEVEAQADVATFKRLTPFQDEVSAKNARLVFDQGFSLPLLLSRTVIDRRGRSGTGYLFGYDGSERGGLYFQKTFEIFSVPLNNPTTTPVTTQRLTQPTTAATTQSPTQPTTAATTQPPTQTTTQLLTQPPTQNITLSLTPQFLLQKALSSNFNLFDTGNYGLKGNLDINLGDNNRIGGIAIFSNLGNQSLQNTLRANIHWRHLLSSGYIIAAEYSFRDRVYNGSLGYRTIQSSIGAYVTSPIIPLWKTGVNLSFQGSIQGINSETDRPALLLQQPPAVNNRVSLSRFQASVALSRGFTLWKGKKLPATPTQGLRYTANPVLPYITLVTGLTGITSDYSDGEKQNAVLGTVGIVGQFGHFSRKYLDSTGFSAIYSQYFTQGQSPFLFDRIADVRVLSVGITQQIYGPFRFGYQTAINLDTNKQINSDYIIEYSRRTYGIILRYNPNQQIGSLNLRISDFNWTGGTDPFDQNFRSIEGGVIRSQ